MQNLTEDQIGLICSFVDGTVKYFHSDVTNSIKERIKQNIRLQLTNIQIYPENIDILRKELINFYYKSLIQPGTNVGVESAQSIGEKITQATLSSFHHCGTTGKIETVGFARLLEIFNATKNQNIVNHKIFFRQKFSTLTEVFEKTIRKIVNLGVGDIIKSSKIENYSHESWVRIYVNVYKNGDRKFWNQIKSAKNIIKIESDSQKLFEFKIHAREICRKIQDSIKNIICIFSPHNQIWIICDDCTIPSEYNDFKNLFINRFILTEVKNVNLSGIAGIRNIFYVPDPEDEKLYCAETSGINSRIISSQYLNFKSLLELDIVDYTRTLSNNIWDIYEVLGIEAVKNYLYVHLMEILDGIEFCHIKLIVDQMTFNGSISSISRHTVKINESGPLSKATFEESVANILIAASRGLTDFLKDISAQVMTGKRICAGTGIVELRYRDPTM